jgi:hypothetical protein
MFIYRTFRIRRHLRRKASEMSKPTTELDDALDTYGTEYLRYLSKRWRRALSIVALLLMLLSAVLSFLIYL